MEFRTMEMDEEFNMESALNDPNTLPKNWQNLLLNSKNLG